MHAQAIGLLLGPLYISESPATWGPRCGNGNHPRLASSKFLQVDERQRSERGY